MSDAVQSSTTNITALVDEIVAARPARVTFRRSHYAGLRATFRKTKYGACEYRPMHGGSVRLLTAHELEEFRAAVQRAIEAAS